VVLRLIAELPTTQSVAFGPVITFQIETKTTMALSRTFFLLLAHAAVAVAADNARSLRARKFRAVWQSGEYGLRGLRVSVVPPTVPELTLSCCCLRTHPQDSPHHS
jgi:hypothetical protein